MSNNGDKGYTITYFNWEDGKKWVAGRFDTKDEKDAFLDKIHDPNSGWLEEELQTIGVINDKNYNLPI